MIGAIIGDIVGSRFEFNNTDDLNFELFTDECSFTDDSICTLAIAYALVSGISYEESLRFLVFFLSEPHGSVWRQLRTLACLKQSKAIQQLRKRFCNARVSSSLVV